MELPKRKDLRPVDGQPAGAAWIWGGLDELGRLNLQTPDKVLSAMASATKGQVIPLNLPFDQPSHPCFGRQAFKNKIVRLDKHAFDETYTLNPQTGSQWDGFRHFGHVKTGFHYNGATADDFVGPKASTRCGIQAWARHGIVGRAILVDFGRYAEQINLELNFYENTKITHADLVRAAKTQGIDLRPAGDGGDVQVADILLIRTGFIKYSQGLSAERRAELHSKPCKFGPGDGQRYIGIEQSEAMLDLLHDSYFSAVVADSPALEAWPSHEDYYLHEHLLALWGVPIGELWDLEALSVACAENYQWTFFLSSAPNNVNGGIGSTSNAIAIL